MRPKATLKADPIQRYLRGLARELHMTYRRLLEELEPGEIAYELAYDEMETDRRNKQAERARAAAEAMQRR